MGYSLSWAAVHGKSADAILDDLGLRRTGAREEPVFREQVRSRGPPRWLDARARRPQRTARARRMAPGHLVGRPGGGLLRRGARDGERDGVDFFFDVPVNLARELTGYRHDEGDYTYEVLEPVPRKGWIARLLGAR